MERCSHGKDMAFACSACIWETNVRAVEKAVREEREAVVRSLRDRAKWMSPAGLLSDDHVSEEFNEEASRIERGEHRK